MQSIETYRKQLRLTRTEAQVYEMLLDLGPLQAADIALGLDTRPHGVYRWLNTLVSRRFAVVRPGRPRVFEAVPLSVVLRDLEQTGAAELSDAREGLLGGSAENGTSMPPVPLHEVSLIYGRQTLYDRYGVEALQATSEILAYTIGIAYDDNLQSVQETVRARGVEVRHIVQRQSRQNYHIIKKWRRIGVKLRYNPAPAGFHLMVFDGRVALLTLSNPHDTEQRTTMVLRNPAAVQALREYFFVTWAASQLAA